MVVKAKKIAPKKIITSRTGVQLTECYCRKCMKMKAPTEFFEATDVNIDQNGKFSICKNCCNDIYNKLFQSELSIEKALLKTCRILNVRYDETALESAKKTLEEMIEKGLTSERFFGTYKANLIRTQGTRITDRDMTEDFSFVEPTSGVVANPMQDDEIDEAHNLKQFWGDNFEYDDYVWLEEEFAEWKKTHKIDTRSEVSLLKMIVLKLYDIRKERSQGHNTSALEKSFQDLLKTSALSPAQSNAASQGKNADTWGMIAKMIEEEDPAEHYLNYKLFDDFFNVKQYCRNYISRPILNFFQGLRNYLISEDDGINLEDDQLESQNDEIRGE